eukprot:jgi/Mesvir1/24275/Mv10975-RA.1
MVRTHGSPTCWQRLYFWKGMPRQCGPLLLAVGLFLVVGCYSVSVLFPPRLHGLSSQDALGVTLPLPVGGNASRLHVDNALVHISSPDNATIADYHVPLSTSHGFVRTEVPEKRLANLHDQDVPSRHPVYSRSDFFEHFRLPVISKPCAYASLAASRQDAIQSIALFKQLHFHNMRNCNFVMLLPRQSLKNVWHHEKMEAYPCDFPPWQDVICPLHGWMRFLDVHVVLADVPFDIKDVEDSNLQNRLMLRMFTAISLLKGVVLGLTEYAKLVFLDSDLLILSNFSEILDTTMGTAASGLVYGEPLNAGMFVVEPNANHMDLYVNIFKTSTYTNYGFNDAWKEEGRGWNFACGCSDQGSLFYLFKLILKSGVWLDPFMYGYPACETEFPPPQFMHPKVVHFKGACKHVPMRQAEHHMKPNAMGGKKYLALTWLAAWHNWSESVVNSRLFKKSLGACKPTNFTISCYGEKNECALSP